MSTRGIRELVGGLLCRPALPFALEVLMIAPLVLAAEVPVVAPYYVIVAPGLVMGLLALNLPLAATVFRRARMDADTRRNHALEHATIHYLERAGTDTFGGRAQRSGFQVYGRTTPSQIREAFEEVAVRVQGRMTIPYISPRCGSNRVTALALGVLLLAAASLASVWLQPPLVVRAALLLAAIGAFVRWRVRVGNWMQDRFFMATDFDEVAVRDIRKVRGSNRGGRLVYLVRTRVA
jgi:hypothetical protein